VQTQSANTLKRQVFGVAQLKVLAFVAWKILSAYAAGLSERDLRGTKDFG
jgi:hypothetical protein